MRHCSMTNFPCYETTSVSYENLQSKSLYNIVSASTTDGLKSKTQNQSKGKQLYTMKLLHCRMVKHSCVNLRNTR
jgi:hypothetical protein